MDFNMFFVFTCLFNAVGEYNRINFIKGVRTMYPGVGLLAAKNMTEHFMDRRVGFSSISINTELVKMYIEDINKRNEMIRYDGSDNYHITHYDYDKDAYITTFADNEADANTEALSVCKKEEKTVFISKVINKAKAIEITEIRPTLEYC